MTGWQLRTLEDIVDFSNGLNFSEKNDGVGLKIVRVKDFGDRHFVDWTELSEINPTGLKISEKVYLEPDDIVIVRSNGNKDLVGRSMIYAGPARTTAFAGFCIRARVRKSQALPKFVHYWLRSPTTREKLSREGGGTGIQNVSQGLLKMQEIALPPLSEQERISGTLAALDDKIELNRRMSATLEEMARALYRSWFVDFDPVHARALGQPPVHMAPTTAALFPDSFGPDGLPKGWERRPFSDQVAIISGGTPKTGVPEYWGGEIPWYSVVDAPEAGAVFVLDTEKKITAAGFDSCSAKMISGGTTIISARGTVGKLAMAAGDMVFNQSCYGLQATRQHTGEFVYFSAVRAVDILQSMSHGSVFSTITRKTFDGLEIVYAPDPVIKAFAGQASVMLERILGAQRESQTLAALRDTLLPRLMSGDLRIREAEKQVEEVL
ncbi:Type I restriction-modification system, specificity subunit S [Roseibacterium elongatum DSM 19469]|uniref:Type I restriction-modification system, specificity subunit S n=1 Tax=Roseicyclus elongatus DSM 19469 TaxID=1294273 RepID=W8S9T5_9RHOB|nr:restriction endonuclease subunit S [Roseibacterium elongatum]AHM05781.1 Type I restriction-modification system, specificity subunit S [Roseibacterium elongatum DSM 19469]